MTPNNQKTNSINNVQKEKRKSSLPGFTFPSILSILGDKPVDVDAFPEPAFTLLKKNHPLLTSVNGELTSTYVNIRADIVEKIHIDPYE